MAQSSSGNPGLLSAGALAAGGYDEDRSFARDLNLDQIVAAIAGNREERDLYRDVSQAVMAHLGRILRWPRPKAVMLTAAIQAVYLYERLGGWRRMVSLQAPARRNALGGPLPRQRDPVP